MKHGLVTENSDDGKSGGVFNGPRESVPQQLMNSPSGLGHSDWGTGKDGIS